MLQQQGGTCVSNAFLLALFKTLNVTSQTTFEFIPRPLGPTYWLNIHVFEHSHQLENLQDWLRHHYNVFFVCLFFVLGFTRIPAREWIDFDVPQGGDECWVSAFSSDGHSFGGPKNYGTKNKTFFNIVFCDDYAMRKGKL